MQFFDDEPKRKPIKISVKKEVYKRAKGRCERCRKKLPFTGGATCYHHRRTPSISPTAKTVQLLCQNCHVEYGHKHKTVTYDKGTIFEEKEHVIKRKKVRKKRTTKAKPKKRATKKKTTKKKAIRKPKRKVKITSKRKKPTAKRKTPKKKTTKKKTTKKKTIKRKTTTKKKSTKKKTTKKKTKRKRRKS